MYNLINKNVNFMKKSAVRGLVFDMDYTLVYPTVKFDKVFEKFFDVPHHAVSDKWLGAIYNNPLDKGYQIIMHSFPNIDTVEAKAKAESFGLEWAKVHNIYPGCIEFLQALKANPDYKLGLLTNGPSDFQRAILDFLDIGKYFDVIVVSGDVGVRKPNLEIFKIMAEKMQLSPESLVMVGDALEKEITPALELGWGGIWITPNTEQIFESNNEDKTINCLNLQNLLENSYAMPTKPLEIRWSDIKVESNC